MEGKSMLKTSGAPSTRSMLQSLVLHVLVLILLMLVPAGALLRSAPPKKELDIVFYRPSTIPIPAPDPPGPRPAPCATNDSGRAPAGARGACTRGETETERPARSRPAWIAGTPTRSGGERSRGPAATAQGWKGRYPGIQGQDREPGNRQDRAESRCRCALRCSR